MAELQTIYIIGGTTEANLAAKHLEQEGYRVIVSVATPLGERAAAAADLKTDAGKKDAAEMAFRAGRLGAGAIVDCSHPFAEEASRQAKKAAAAAGMPYLRYCRPPLKLHAGGHGSTSAGPAAGTAARTSAAKDSSVLSTAGTAVIVDSFEDAASKMRAVKGPALLTLGTRHLKPFVQAGLEFTARVLPLAQSIEDCTRLGIDPAKIIAAWPPFTTDFNRACLRRAGAVALITKDSGREGGIEQKLAAAEEEGATVILVARPEEPDAIHDLETLAARLAAALADRQADKPDASPAKPAFPTITT